MTFYQYEGDRLVASVSVPEPEFSAADVAALVASRRAEAAPRDAYGVLLSEATDPELRYSWAPEPVTDFVVEAVEKAREKVKKDFPDTNMAGWMWTVKRPNGS